MDANTPQTTSVRRKSLRLTALALGSAATVGLIAGFGPNATVGAADTAAQSAQPVQAWQGYADLIEQVMPSVVAITARSEAPQPGPMARNNQGQEFGSPFGEGPQADRFKDFMERFFGPNFGERFGGPETPHGFGGPEMPPHGFGGERMAAGSGFIISKDGKVVTNNHVVAGATDVTVKLHDGTELEAKILGRDPDTDLALLKVETDRDLQPVEFADANKVRVGDPVVAIGSPFGLGGTVTAGIISADHRAIGAGRYDDFLQIDAPINRGNSGGPTFNLDGKVVGVNTLIHSPSGGNVGIGFAIPSDLAMQIVDDLSDDGQVERGFLGVQIQSIDEDLAQSLGLEEAHGALVAQLTPDAPAERAGIRQGDVIVGYAGQPIETLRDLTRAVADTDPGKAAEVVVWRDGEEQTLEVEVAQMPGEEQQVAAAEQPGDSDNPRLGVSLAELTPEVRQQLQLDQETQGAVITDVMPGSPAAEKGLQAGDVIVEADRAEVQDPQAVVDAVESAAERGDEQILLLVKRDGQNRFVAVPFQRA